MPSWWDISRTECLWSSVRTTFDKQQNNYTLNSAYCSENDIQQQRVSKLIQPMNQSIPYSQLDVQKDILIISSKPTIQTIFSQKRHLFELWWHTHLTIVLIYWGSGLHWYVICAKLIVSYVLAVVKPIVLVVELHANGSPFINNLLLSLCWSTSVRSGLCKYVCYYQMCPICCSS